MSGQLACFWAVSVTVTCRYVMPIQANEDLQDDCDDDDNCDCDMHVIVYDIMNIFVNVIM